MKVYDPTDWYWIVAGDDKQLWSSAAGAYVQSDDAAYKAWLAAGGLPSRIASAAELDEVLNGHGIDGPTAKAPRLIVLRDFMDRLTAEKQAAVFAASLTDPNVARLVARASSAPFNLESAETAAGIDYLIGQGLLDAADKTVLLA